MKSGNSLDLRIILVLIGALVVSLFVNNVTGEECKTVLENENVPTETCIFERCERELSCDVSQNQGVDLVCRDPGEEEVEEDGEEEEEEEEIRNISYIAPEFFQNYLDDAQKSILDEQDPEEKRRKAMEVQDNTMEMMDLYMSKLSVSESTRSQARSVKSALHTLENVGPIIATSLEVGEVMIRRQNDLEMILTKIPRSAPNMNLQFSQSSSVELSPKNIVIMNGNAGSGDITTAAVCSALLGSTGNLAYELMPKAIKTQGPKRMVNTDVLMLALRIGDLSTENLSLSKNVSLTLKMSHTEGMTQPVCVSFDVESMTPTSRGCYGQHLNATHVRCLCSHLTSFAAIMSVVEVDESIEADPALKILSNVCLSVSVVSLLLAVLTFIGFERLHTERYFSLGNLSFSLGLGQALYLFGIGQVSNKVACAVIAGLMHFLFLSAFCWMGVEGLQIYFKLVKVYRTSVDTKPIFFFIGYGVPIIIVAISAGIYSDGYGTKMNCWLSKDRYFHFAFIVPVLLILAFNVIMLSVAMIIMRRHISSKTKDKESTMIAKQMKGAVSLMALLGIAWVFGAFQFNGTFTTIFSYLFVILNGTQGVFIYTFQCLINNQVRTEYFRAVQRSSLCPESCKHSLLRILGKGLESLTETGYATTRTKVPSATRQRSSHSGVLSTVHDELPKIDEIPEVEAVDAVDAVEADGKEKGEEKEAHAGLVSPIPSVRSASVDLDPSQMNDKIEEILAKSKSGGSTSHAASVDLDPSQMNDKVEESLAKSKSKSGGSTSQAILSSGSRAGVGMGENQQT